MIDILSWFDKWGVILNTIGSLGLSLFLVILYRQQYKIQKRQHELLEKDKEPIVEVSDYEFSEQRIHIWLSNSGNGTATDLELITQVALPETNIIKSELSYSDVFKGNPNSPFIGESSLAGNSERVKFTSFPGMTLRDFPMYDGAQDFKLGTEGLYKCKIEGFQFMIYMTYTDHLDRTQLVPVTKYPQRVELIESMDVETASNSNPHTGINVGEIEELTEAPRSQKSNGENFKTHLRRHITRGKSF